jgi:hypothetical protein
MIRKSLVRGNLKTKLVFNETNFVNINLIRKIELMFNEIKGDDTISELCIIRSKILHCENLTNKDYSYLIGMGITF